MIVTALLAALYDIARQIIASDRESKVKVADVIITFGTYVVIVCTLLSMYHDVY